MRGAGQRPVVRPWRWAWAASSKGGWPLCATEAPPEPPLVRSTTQHVISVAPLKPPGHARVGAPRWVLGHAAAPACGMRGLGLPAKKQGPALSHPPPPPPARPLFFLSRFNGELSYGAWPGHAPGPGVLYPDGIWDGQSLVLLPFVYFILPRCTSKRGANARSGHWLWNDLLKCVVIRAI
jgi:hypothetical protein